MKNLICIDSSTHQASLALFHNGNFIAEKQSLQQRSHSEFVTVALEQLCRERGLAIQAIDGIAVTQGPGSFTGIRVGIGISKALAYSNSTSIWTTNTLNVLRTQVRSSEPCFAALNAYKNLVFGAFYEPGQLSSVPSVLSYESAAQLISKKCIQTTVHLIGEGIDLFSDMVSSQFEMKNLVRVAGDQLPRAQWLGELLFASPESGQTLDWKSINPLYLRGSEAEENLRIHSSENT